MLELKNEMSDAIRFIQRCKLQVNSGLRF